MPSPRMCKLQAKRPTTTQKRVQGHAAPEPGCQAGGDQLRASMSNNARTIQILNCTSRGIGGITRYNQQQELDRRTLVWYDTRSRSIKEAMAAMERPGPPS